MNPNKFLIDNPVNSKFGAPLGTKNTVDSDDCEVTLAVVAIDSQGYDPSGTYWGTGMPLWCAMSDEGDTEIYVRAASFEQASKAILEMHPDLKIVRPTEICTDLFIAEYIRAMLWSTTDDDDNHLDRNYSIDDISPEFAESIKNDCEAFIEQNAKDLLTWDGRYSVEEMGGHDFWLTRNGHGSGFWDGDWEKEAGKRLTKSSKSFGEVYVYVGDDGLIYG